MQKIKQIIKRFIKKDGILYRIIRKMYHILRTIKYKITNYKRIKIENKHYTEQANKAVEILSKYQGKDYVVFYNPTWLGVANSTKGLFENIIPLEHIYKVNDIKNIAEAINQNNVKSVIFSQICDGWTSLIEEIKRINASIKVKVIWHGNCYEFFSDFTWNLNKKVMEMYKQSKIDSFGFVRSTMYEFYKKVGFKSFYLQNNVYVKDELILEKIEKKDKKIKIGIYNADTRELKNIYTSLSAIKLVPNAVADVVPINDGASRFVELLNLETTSINDYITTDELLKRIQENELNVYPTFTENSPMFPLESFEVGIPCLLGNNNDYFVGTKLGEYVILDKEDDAEYIKNKIINVIEHKEEIMNLYKDWKKDFDKKCNKLVEEFLKDGIQM